MTAVRGENSFDERAPAGYDIAVLPICIALGDSSQEADDVSVVPIQISTLRN
jgi:hypothetical protein